MALAELSYLGEPSPRRPWVAFALSLLCPGLGFAYVGRTGLAVALALGSVALWGLFVFSWWALEYYPTAPLFGFGLGWCLLVLMVAWDARAYAARAGEGYIAQDSNHVVVYTVIVLFAFLLPLGGLARWTLSGVWLRVPVVADSMYPTLIPGDVVWVRRMAYVSSMPRFGEIVAYRPEPTGGVAIGRVIGTPGDKVVLAEGAVYVNDAPLPQRFLTQEGIVEVEAQSGTREARALLAETNGRVDYLVSTSSQARWGGPEYIVANWGYVLLHDARDLGGDSRQLGAIDVADILGPVRFLAEHRGASELSESRAARRVEATERQRNLAE